MSDKVFDLDAHYALHDKPKKGCATRGLEQQVLTLIAERDQLREENKQLKEIDDKVTDHCIQLQEGLRNAELATAEWKLKWDSERKQLTTAKGALTVTSKKLDWELNSGWFRVRGPDKRGMLKAMKMKIDEALTELDKP